MFSRILALLAALILSTMAHPVNAATYQETLKSCNAQTVTILYNIKTNSWMITEQSQAAEGTLPASTFKIMNSLIALETGATKPVELYLWDGVKRDYEVWNQDMNLALAMKHSAVWVHERLRSRLKTSTYKTYLAKSNYGNGKLETGKNGNFWVYGDFKVTPRQQIDLLVKLYKNQLPFSLANQTYVKKILEVEDDTLPNLHAKTGWTRKDGKHIGWWIGYTIRENQPLFFATRIIRDEKDGFEGFLECRKSITRKAIELYRNTNG
ncbi:MAG: beta-lactamase [Rhodomicrobium sp.]|nr:MAG: beta-lactamase [Rhodomicrobium sp.]